MIKKYRKKQIVEACQWTGDNFDEICELSTNTPVYEVDRILEIRTHIGNGIAIQGDYIIKNSRGDCYAKEKNVFEEMYEEVTEEK